MVSCLEPRQSELALHPQTPHNPDGRRSKFRKHMPLTLILFNVDLLADSTQIALLLHRDERPCHENFGSQITAVISET